MTDETDQGELAHPRKIDWSAEGVDVPKFRFRRAPIDGLDVPAYRDLSAGGDDE